MSEVVFASIEISFSIADGVQAVIIVVSSLGHLVSEGAGATEWARLLDHVSGGSSHGVGGLVDDVLIGGDHVCKMIRLIKVLTCLVVMLVNVFNFLLQIHFISYF